MEMFSFYRYNPEAPYLQYFRHVPSRRFLTGGRRALYRLDIELGRLEFLEHPLASREDILAGQLLAAFREYKKRERAGLAAFYADKVKALQASVDAARGGSKWAVGEGGAAARMPATLDDHPAGAPMTIKRLGSSKNETADVAQNGLTLADPEGPDARVAEMRAELREARELRDGEERLMRELVARMRDVYREVEEARQRQGFRWAFHSRGFVFSFETCCVWT